MVGKPFDGKTLKMHAISGGNYEELYKLIPAWEEKTGAKVEFVFKGNGFETDKRLVQDMSAGTVDYDVCWDHSSFFSQYVKLDGLEPIDNHFSAEDLQDFIPRLVDATKRDGHIWVMPRHFDISCNHYRTDLGIAKAPETWDEFKQIALDVTKANPGIFGTQFAGKEEALSGRFYEVLTAEGGNLFNDKWEPTFNEAPGVKAATMFADLYKAKAMPPDMTNFLWEDVAKQFAARPHRPVHRVARLVRLLPGSGEQQGRGQVRHRPPAQGRWRHQQRLGRPSRLLHHQGLQGKGDGG